MTTKHFLISKNLLVTKMTTANKISIKFLFFSSLITSLLFCDYSYAQNLIRNGDFESGGSGVGFVVKGSGYNEITAPFTGTTVPGNYAFTTNPQPMNTASFIAGGDHTTGTGKMMVVDGSTLSGNRRFWQVGNTGSGICGLTIGETYTFSYWLKSVSSTVTNIDTQASIGVFFSGVTDVFPANTNTIAPLPASGWLKVVYTLKATSTCISVELWNNNINSIGNDFAVDDFSFTAPPVALSLSYTYSNPLCPNSVDGTITATGVGGSFPYSSYTLSSIGITSVTNNSGVFTGLPAGTYSVSVTDDIGGIYKRDGIVLTNPSGLSISQPVTICSGDTTTLSVSGSSSSYSWTASPADASLTNPNSGNPIVKPTQTTTYTVTSNPISDNAPNLVANGDFSLGNVGFINDYQYIDNTGGGLQRAYGVVTNANSWFSAFSNCNKDHSGNGNMLIADGSILNSGNDRIWEQTITVIPNQDYTFSYWLQTIALPDPSLINIKINDVSIGTDTAPSSICGWVEHKHVWNSGSNTTARIAIYDKIFSANGNDFALDDISFKINATCNLSKSVVVTVNQPLTPTFNIIKSYCTGSVIPALPTTSINGIQGTWSPSLNNIATTEYTFTPNSSQCATSIKTTITVSTSINPQFNVVAPICSGGILLDLPTTSLNNITGTWSPALNNTTTTKYTFTPSAGQCGVPTDLTIVVNPKTTPNFNLIAPVCSGDNLAELPTTSVNEITGTWSPALNNTATTNYTFTPNSNECATTTTQTITVLNPSVAITAGCIDSNYTLKAIASENNATYTWYKGDTLLSETTNTLVVTETDTYKVMVTGQVCTVEGTENVTSLNCKIFIPRGISPNGDTKNDFFDLSNYSVNKLEIFNRYGLKVYSKSNYKKEWTGTTDSGQELPDGTYYYVVELTSGDSKTGWVYINR